jgi:PAS domain S-box-containing protein
MLQGEAPSSIRLPPYPPGTPQFDWRQIVRWRIDPARLPPGSVIRFREPTFWQRYTWGILVVGAIGALQTGMILLLLVTLKGRRRAQQGLRESREQYALAVDGSMDGLWDWDISAGAVFLSVRGKEILGWRDGETVCDVASWNERVHPDDREAVQAALRSHLEGRTSSFGAECRLHGDGHGQRWILVRGKALRDAEGRAYRMAGSMTDITDRRVAEQAARDVSRRLIVVQEEERARLARELHDDVTQRLARLAIDAGRVERESPGTSTGETMREVREGLASLSEDVHALSYRLHPALLEVLGLADALQAECERFSRQTSLPAQLKVRQIPAVVPPGVSICLFRIAQEALRNVGRHARAQHVELTLQELDGGLQLAVRDDGVGFDPAAHSGQPSLGHASMRERVQLAGGRIDIESAPGQGTTVVAWVPLDERRS